eukprot:2350354-Lingulodinium_polyedra.AAC.1
MPVLGHVQDWHPFELPSLCLWRVVVVAGAKVRANNTKSKRSGLVAISVAGVSALLFNPPLG